MLCGHVLLNKWMEFAEFVMEAVQFSLSASVRDGFLLQVELKVSSLILHAGNSKKSK